MAGAVIRHDDHDEWVPPAGDALADRLFGIVMAGVVGVIVLMLVAANWGTGA